MTAYSLHIPDDLLQDAKEIAKQSNTPLDQFFLSAIAERIGAERTKRLFQSLAAHADFDTFQKILDRVPDTLPVPGDEVDP